MLRLWNFGDMLSMSDIHMTNSIGGGTNIMILVERY